MKAAMQSRYGSVDVVELRDVPKPEPGRRELLVRVRAASVNRADLDGLTPRPGFVRLFYGIRRPRNPRMGWDVAGEVESIGPGVERFRPGDRVFADLAAHGAGSFAEYVNAPATAFEPMPDGMPFEEAATLPHSAVLAVQGFRTRKGRTFKAGDRVLVVGASGNVGPFAVQIAKAHGAHVTGVASASKLDMVHELGADAVIDYRTTDWTRTGERWDWILDTDSHRNILSVRRALAPGGAYVTLGGNAWPILAAMTAGPLVSLFSSKWSGLMLWWKPFNRADVERVLELIAEGKVHPVIDRSYPLAEVRDALRRVADGEARGKVLVLP
ncbi:MAG TPA: NAD(P)-dependent alcohol dehydrogenase [Candidatus Limnocylindria bacterium]|jgi:NADPH:quinone reductase-like Zn-dependent oxidoreductase